jgi:hypothetical protein
MLAAGKLTNCVFGTKAPLPATVCPVASPTPWYCRRWPRGARCRPGKAGHLARRQALIGKPRRAPRLRLKLSFASTMRASIITCRVAMSVLAISRRICSSAPARR